MPLEEIDGLQLGDTVTARSEEARVPVGPALLGRVIDGFGKPIDGAPPPPSTESYSLYGTPGNPLDREPIVKPLATGIRVIDGLLPCGQGQRMGLFGGSGVGKSTLLGSMSRHNSADVTVIAMVGERNREVRAFLEKELGPEGRRKSVVVVATSERPATLRVRACFVALAVAEYFRDQGAGVLLVMDSVTRLAMAQREIGLAAGEPPSQKGYTPSVFNLLPKVLERAGNFRKGSITGFFTVLVEGDDFNEPICRRGARHSGWPHHSLPRAGRRGALSGDRRPALGEPADVRDRHGRPAGSGAQAAAGTGGLSRGRGPDPAGGVCGGFGPGAGCGDPAAARNAGVSAAGPHLEGAPSRYAEAPRRSGREAGGASAGGRCGARVQGVNAFRFNLERVLELRRRQLDRGRKPLPAADGRAGGDR